MLDNNLIEQLKTVFGKLENNVELVYKRSAHSSQNELIEMLTDVASTSDKITLSQIDEVADYPQFFLKYNNIPNGVQFFGIPNGHEFSSLIIAILNSDGKGKIPDESILNRIKNLKGSISLRTIISLTCENCPDVVQSLNLMAIINPNFKHTMVDGAFIQDEITKLGIQGVPSVMNNDKLSHGKKKILLANLLHYKNK